MTRHRRKEKLTEELTKASLWKPHADGFLIHDYLDYNPSHEELKAKREREKVRLRDSRTRQTLTNGAAGSLQHSDHVAGNVPAGSSQVGEATHARRPGRAPGGRAGISDPDQNNPAGGIDGASVTEPEAAAPKPDPEVFASPMPTEAKSRVEAFVAEITRHPSLARVNALAIAKAYENATMTGQKPIAWVLDAIRECAVKHAGSGLTSVALGNQLASFMMHARRPRTPDEPANAASRMPQESPDDRATREQQAKDRETYLAVLAQRRAKAGEGPKGAPT